MNILFIYHHVQQVHQAIAPLVLAAIIMAAHQARVSYQQSQKAKALEKGLSRPGYTTPDEIRMNLINAQKKRARASLSGFPGQGQIQNRIEGNAAAGNAAAINTGQDAPAIMNTIAANNEIANKATEKIGIDAVNDQNTRIDTADAGVSNALRLAAAGKDQEFNYNQDEPYKARVAAISALKESSQRNQDSALSTGLMAMGNGQGSGNRMPQTTPSTQQPLQTTATVPGAMTEGNNTGPIVATNPTVATDRTGYVPPVNNGNQATPGYETQHPLATNSNDALIDALQRQHPQYSREQIKSMYGGLN